MIYLRDTATAIARSRCYPQLSCTERIMIDSLSKSHGFNRLSPNSHLAFVMYYQSMYASLQCGTKPHQKSRQQGVTRKSIDENEKKRN